MDEKKYDKNDRAIQLLLTGQNKEKRDKMNETSKFKKMGTVCGNMGDSVTNNYNNRPIQLLKRKNIPNKRRLSQIADQE